MNLATLSAAVTDSAWNKSPRGFQLQLDFSNLWIHKMSLSWRSVEQIQLLHLVGQVGGTCSGPIFSAEAGDRLSQTNSSL